MRSLDETVAYLDEILTPHLYQDKCYNGLQVKGKSEVSRVAFGLDASLQLFQQASRFDMIVVHHGLIWGGIERIGEPLKERLRILLQKDISLYCSHHPLDAHPEIGTAATLAKGLGLKNIGHYGASEHESWGKRGEFERELSINEAAERLETIIGTKPLIFDMRERPISKVAIVTGQGASEISRYAQEPFDLFITGEPSHNIYHYAREMDIDLLFGGHYATETPGLKALMRLFIKHFPDLEVKFIDMPTCL